MSVTPGQFLADNLTFPQTVKEQPWRDERWLDRVRGLPCLVSGCKQPATPHHIFSKGHTRNWSHDFFAIPLCMAHHDELGGVRNLDVILAWVKTMKEILSETDLAMADGESKPSPRVKKPAQKPASDFTKRCAALSDEQLAEAGIRLPETMKRIHNGIIGAVEKRKLKEYLKA